MSKLREITAWLDEQLRLHEIPDYAGAMNGLQLENEGDVEMVIAAVDSTLPVIRKALKIAQGRPALLLVHHGLFWQGAQPWVGATYQKLKEAMQGNLAIYSAHLPLDVHPEFGNNVLLAKALGVKNTEPCMPSKFGNMGLKGDWEGTREELQAALERVLGGRVHGCLGGARAISRVAIVTGGAGSEVELAKREGVDAFITGEGPHWSYGLAEESELNVFYGGHYNTEVFGVKNIARIISSHLQLLDHFVDHPTGL